MNKKKVEEFRKQKQKATNSCRVDNQTSLLGGFKTTVEGVSSVNTLTGTVCNIVYETDEEEFEDTAVGTVSLGERVKSNPRGRAASTR